MYGKKKSSTPAGSEVSVPLMGPLYTPPSKGGESLGAHQVEGPVGGIRPPDTLGITHGITSGIHPAGVKESPKKLVPTYKD